jgi:hypothetical protein
VQQDQRDLRERLEQQVALALQVRRDLRALRVLQGLQVRQDQLALQEQRGQIPQSRDLLVLLVRLEQQALRVLWALQDLLDQLVQQVLLVQRDLALCGSQLTITPQLTI